jgi:hypothetical protein
VIIKGSQPLTTLEPQALLKVLKGKHIYYKLVQKNSRIQRTKPIYWSEIKLHNQWTLEILVALPKIEKKNAIDDLKYITKKKKKKRMELLIYLFNHLENLSLIYLLLNDYHLLETVSMSNVRDQLFYSKLM